VYFVRPGSTDKSESNFNYQYENYKYKNNATAATAEVEGIASHLSAQKRRGEGGAPGIAYSSTLWKPARREAISGYANPGTVFGAEPKSAGVLEESA
jgi:hypothetical protein